MLFNGKQKWQISLFLIKLMPCQNVIVSCNLMASSLPQLLKGSPFFFLTENRAAVHCKLCFKLQFIVLHSAPLMSALRLCFTYSHH